MQRNERKNALPSLVWFFLKTFLFNPQNNPTFLVIFILIIFFYLERSLNRYHIALMLYLAVLAHYFVGNIFKGPGNGEEETSRVPIIRYFQVLPISGRKIYLSYLLATGIYGLFTWAVLGFLLATFMKLPDLKNIEFIKSVAPDGDTVTILTGFGLNERGIPGFVSIPLKKSLIFDPISKISGNYIWLSLLYILVFIYICTFQVFNQFNQRSYPYLLKLLHKLPLGIYLCIGLGFLTELLFSQKQIGICTRLIIQHLGLLALLLLVTIIATSISIGLMSRFILDRLKVIS